MFVVFIYLFIYCCYFFFHRFRNIYEIAGCVINRIDPDQTSRLGFYPVWNTSKQFKSQALPSAQIQFEGKNHWTMSFQTPLDPDTVYYIDNLSENIKGLKNNVQIQLCQIYCKDQKFGTQNFVTVKIPRVQQQPNSYDCGVFALASLVDFCFNPATFNFRTCYLVSEMRL